MQVSQKTMVASRLCCSNINICCFGAFVKMTDAFVLSVSEIGREKVRLLHP